jgi:hypothetical protein
MLNTERVFVLYDPNNNRYWSTQNASSTWGYGAVYVRGANYFVSQEAAERQQKRLADRGYKRWSRVVPVTIQYEI